MNPFKTRYEAHPFEVGDKVIMVTHGPAPASQFKPLLKFNRLYVVRDAAFRDDEAAVRLVGIFGRECWDGAEMWLKASHFISLAELRANVREREAALRGLQLEFAPEPCPEPAKKRRGRRRKSVA